MLITILRVQFWWLMALAEPSCAQEDSLPQYLGPRPLMLAPVVSPIVAMSGDSEPPPPALVELSALADVHHVVNLAQQIDRYQIIPLHLHNS